MENQIIQDIIKDLGMTIGIEIETVREINSVVLNHLRNEITDIEFNDVGYTHRTTPFWKIVRDGSTHGAELVSPILNQENVFDQITRICQSLNRMEHTEVNKSCGLHIHLKWNGMTVDHIKRIVKRYYDYRNDIDLIMPLSRRANNNQYCLEISPSDIRRIERHNGNLYQMANLIKNGSYSTRYKKINLESLRKYGTVEFRQHSGTIDHTKILNWLCFLVGFVNETINNDRTSDLRKTHRKNTSNSFGEIKMLFAKKGWTVKYSGGKKFTFFNENNEMQFIKTSEELTNFYFHGQYIRTEEFVLNSDFVLFYNSIFNLENLEPENFYSGIDTPTRTYLVDRHNHFATLEGRSTI